MADQLLTPGELATLLRIPLSAAWKLGREGPLRGATIRIGNRMRFRAVLVNAWIERGGACAPEQTPSSPASIT